MNIGPVNIFVIVNGAGEYWKGYIGTCGWGTRSKDRPRPWTDDISKAVTYSSLKNANIKLTSLSGGAHVRQFNLAGLDLVDNTAFLERKAKRDKKKQEKVANSTVDLVAGRLFKC